MKGRRWESLEGEAAEEAIVTSSELNRKISELRLQDSKGTVASIAELHLKYQIDWTGSEDASAVLLEEMLVGGFHFAMWPQPDGTVVLHYADGLSDSRRVHGYRKTAIALAYAAWKGKA